jgi:hypothetical protein
MAVADFRDYLEIVLRQKILLSSRRCNSREAVWYGGRFRPDEAGRIFFMFRKTAKRTLPFFPPAVTRAEG